ncbi:hypothetical protein OO007_19880 [Cocleimonas sp. KMM 6892]|uniref:hypothetical protein n=1 Tax=unclassified Cocleimonas TaxID=2639732 RepID=UPI002DB71365|nr:MULTISPECIES: hypothetical protein [unclassified Cocleimonas]MEB8434508.1 hypothetical protein [Cocleimonas sp. KMM 6892]MEC4717401.1 hypothetical protein [Cocleimonas sp. KMM 6895]MEC4746805.1 hypothetical protein [Cocleimonas sp. KMM 6896]
MKNSLLIALLGLTVSVVTPSIAAADDFKFGPNKNYKNDQHRNHKHKRVKKDVAKHHNAKQKQIRRVTKVKPPKPPKLHQLPHKRIIAKLDNKSQKRHNKRYIDNRKHVKKHVKPHNERRHYNKPQSSFSITWSSNAPQIGYNNVHRKGVYNKGARQAFNIYERQKRQQSRIHQGRENGQLVKREVKQLRQEQRQIQHKIAYYKRDGRLNRHEKSRINHLQNVASNNIRNKMNNRLTRWSQPRNNHYDYAWY